MKFYAIFVILRIEAAAYHPEGLRVYRPRIEIRQGVECRCQPLQREVQTPLWGL
jgi:hypothetical protein